MCFSQRLTRRHCNIVLSHRSPPADGSLSVIVLSNIFFLVYIVCYLASVRRQFLALARHPYNKYRLGNRLMRVQVGLVWEGDERGGWNKCI